MAKLNQISSGSREGQIRNSKGRKYDYYIEFNWMNLGFSWLHDWWYYGRKERPQKQGTNIWVFIKKYPSLFRSQIIKWFDIDLANDSNFALGEWFEQTGLFKISGTDIPYHAGYKIELFIDLVKDYFKRNAEWEM